MAVCGDRYKHIAVTAGGYSFRNPYGLVAEAYAYAQWKALAQKVIGLVNEHLASLQAIEVVKEPKMTYFLQYTNERTGLLTNFENLPSTAYAALSGFHAEESITEAMAVVSEALCLLQQTDEAIEFYGGKAPEVPGVTPEAKDPPKLPTGEIPWYLWAIGGLAAAAVIGGLYYRVRGPYQVSQRSERR